MGDEGVWICEDELPEGYPYDEMYPLSKLGADGLGGVRIFPSVGEAIASLCAEVARLKDSLEILGQRADLEKMRADIAEEKVALKESQLRAKDIVAGKLAEQVARLEKERDESNEVCKHAVAEMVDAIAELNHFRALNEHLPPGFDIGDDATAELAIKLVAAEAHIRELEEKK